MTKKIFADVHIIQTVPPSCVNRDDTGSPKTAVYGGVTRARVSSQCWKKAVRDMFREESVFSADKLGLRTKKIVGVVAEEIRKIDGAVDADDLAVKILLTAGLKNINASTANNDALFFIGAAQAKALAELILNDPGADKKAAQKALNDSPGIDVALFGRMVAVDQSLNTDACAQVAHAISTHRVNNEFDYFTAVDDVSKEESTGAGHIGTVEFNSSTLYRYATVAVHLLHDLLSDDAADAVCEFIRAFACSMPTGKQNTFANRTIPDAMLITLRSDQPVNLVGAFEKPVTSDGGFVAGSIDALTCHTKSIYKNWLKEPDASFVVGDAANGLGDPMPLFGALGEFKKSVADMLAARASN